MKTHATEQVTADGPTLCKRDARDVAIDNADPTCKQCLRVIDSRLRAAGHR